MTFRSRWLVEYLAAALALAIRWWVRTLRVRMVTADGRKHPADPRRGRFIYTFWHEGLLAPLAAPAAVRVLISQHTDGELIAQICQRLGIGVIRGSTARGGSQALLEMIRSGGDSHLAITPDGPRGPRRQLKPGAVMVASLSGLAIVPIGIGFVRAWRAGSWDRFAIPCPFSTLVGVIGEPIHVPRDLDRGGMKQWTQHVEQQMLELTERAEDWALRVRRTGRRAAIPPVPGRTALPKSA
jgi:lysophospholipid acyltransferase (LPLAT)-like uncharacterized protein